ncbi:MAG: LysM peptidoglycan-binding domain-containing protein [Candidatus Neomarinimicrobiota bacterium]
MIFLFILFNSFLYAELQDSAQVLQKIKIIPKDSIVIIKDSTSINNSLIKDSISINRSNIVNDSIDFIENFKFNEENDIFYEQLIESKLTFADAITYDISLDTLEAEVQFQSLFASFEFLDSLSLDDEYKRIEYNMVLNASIDYYQNKSVTINRLESPLSMALFKEKLEAYFYKQQLEDVEFVDETVEFIDGHIPITFNSKVARNVKYFSSNGAKKGVQMWLNRINKYKKIMLPILEEEGVPPEIFYVSVIESGLNPIALSYAQALGPWQFIASTGKIYGLEKNWFIDERRDFIKSTYAAARYLKDLKKIFDKVNPEDLNGENWYLALAAYNCGASRVLKEIKRSNSTNFWDLNRLPGQTRNYVPKILAIFLINKNPEKYGFIIKNEPDLEWIIKKIDKQVSFNQISDITKVSPKELLIFNPEIKRGIIQPRASEKYYNLRLPKSYDYTTFDSLYLLLNEQSAKSLLIVEHIVKRGESLSRISSKYKVKIQDITSMNNISAKNYLQPGQKLQIPTQGYDEYVKSLISSSSSTKVYHTVKSGDTLSEIANQYKTSIKKIKKWNGIREIDNVIYLGKKLIIYTSVKNIDKINKNSNKEISYKVKYGDSLSKISYKYGVRVTDIRKWNGLKDDLIKVGQDLIIKTKN